MQDLTLNGGLRRRGLAAYWPLASAGAVKLTASPNPLNTVLLTNANVVTPAVGPSNNLRDAAEFNGTNQFLNTASTPNLVFGGRSFTVAGWVLFDNFTARRLFFSKWSATGGAWREITIDAAITTGISTVNISADGSIAAISATGATFATGVWYFVVVRYSLGSPRVSIWVNGVETITVGTGVIPGALRTGLARFCFGGESELALWHDGKMSGWGYWHRYLTAKEVNWLYNNGQGRDLERGV